MQRTEHKKREPLFHVVKNNKFKWYRSLLTKLLFILIGFVIACIVLIISVNANPVTILVKMFEGCFSTSRRLFITLRDTALILIVSLALIPAFKMRFWNLGGNGQISVSALVGIMCMLYLGNFGLPEWAVIIIMVFACMLAGAIWAVIPAIFKAYFGTNESLFTLMMNYVAAGLISLFLSIAVKEGSGTLKEVTVNNLPIIYNQYMLTIIVAVIVFVLMFVYLRYSKHGYEIEVVGGSKNTAKYIGINVNKVIIRTLILSGAVCGLVGLLLAGSIDHTIKASINRDLGFTAIMAAWLGKFNPIAIVGTSFLISFVDNGISNVQSFYGITSDAVASIVISIIYFSLIASEFFTSYKVMFTRFANRKVKKQKELKNILFANLLPETKEEM